MQIFDFDSAALGLPLSIVGVSFYDDGAEPTGNFVISGFHRLEFAKNVKKILTQAYDY